MDTALSNTELAAAVPKNSDPVSGLAARAEIPCVPANLGQMPGEELQQALAVASRFAVPLMDLGALDISSCPVNLVATSLLKQHGVFPLARLGKTLFLACSNPADNEAFADISFHTGLKIELVIAVEAQLKRLVNRHESQRETDAIMLRELQGIDLDDIEISSVDVEQQYDDSAVDEAPIVRFVNKILLDAINGGVSDVHFEPYETRYRIRYRRDGILLEVAQPPVNLAGRIAARVKVMASLDISEKRMPQDGRIKLRLPQSRAIDLRVNTLPTLWGEKIVLRLLGSSRYSLNMDSLGFSPQQQRLYRESLSARQGLILVTGPTGSGKTVTLYAGLNSLNNDERNISTAEDPVEINLEGINQVAVNPRKGLDFAAALRAFLRQDPDVIMVGEIRDSESADIAVKAAQTGHLVLSTLHTNNAAETLVRLRNMGISDYNLAASVSLIMAQRLLRRLCNHCKEIVEIPEKVLLEEGFSEARLDSLKINSAIGCERCNTGYRGRIGIYEVVPIIPAINRIIMAGGNSLDIAECARREGFPSLRQSALDKVARGLTSLDEANRLTR